MKKIILSLSLFMVSMNVFAGEINLQNGQKMLVNNNVISCGSSVPPCEVRMGEGQILINDVTVVDVGLFTRFSSMMAKAQALQATGACSSIVFK